MDSLDVNLKSITNHKLKQKSTQNKSQQHIVEQKETKIYPKQMSKKIYRGV